MWGIGWLTFGGGAVIGLAALLIYLLAGGSTFFLVPPWAEIAFYPGFYTGTLTYELCSSVLMGEIVGCLTVSLCYGLAAWLPYYLVADFMAIRRGRL